MKEILEKELKRLSKLNDEINETKLYKDITKSEYIANNILAMCKIYETLNKNAPELTEAQLEQVNKYLGKHF